VLRRLRSLHRTLRAAHGSAGTRLGEVSVRRLALVDEHGDERLVVECDRAMTRLALRAPGSSSGRMDGIELSATGPIDDDPSIMTIALMADGSVVRAWDGRSVDP
jgi:hypothetical protein